MPRVSSPSRLADPAGRGSATRIGPAKPQDLPPRGAGEGKTVSTAFLAYELGETIKKHDWALVNGSANESDNSLEMDGKAIK